MKDTPFTRVPDIQIWIEDFVRKLVAQGPSFMVTDLGCHKCVYRSSDCRKCAVGMMIPDELYSLELEGIGVSHQRFLRAITGHYNTALTPTLEQQFMDLIQVPISFDEVILLQEAHDKAVTDVKERDDLRDDWNPANLAPPPKPYTWEDRFLRRAMDSGLIRESFRP
jgi:hypothetical protein